MQTGQKGGGTTPSPCNVLQNIAAQILIFHHIGQMFSHVIAVDHQLRAGHVGSVKGNIRQDLFHDGIQTTRADVFGFRVDLFGKGGYFLQPVGTETQLDLLRAQQGLVLLGQGIVRFRKNKRPCSSGIMSDGLLKWKAPAAMNRM